MRYLRSTIDANALAFCSCLKEFKITVNNSMIAEAALEDKLADFCPMKIQDFTHVYRLAAPKRLWLCRSNEREGKTSSSSDILESRFSSTSAISTSVKHEKNACALALITGLIAETPANCEEMFNRPRN